MTVNTKKTYSQVLEELGERVLERNISRDEYHKSREKAFLEYLERGELTRDDLAREEGYCISQEMHQPGHKDHGYFQRVHLEFSNMYHPVQVERRPRQHAHVNKAAPANFSERMAARFSGNSGASAVHPGQGPEKTDQTDPLFLEKELANMSSEALAALAAVLVKVIAKITQILEQREQQQQKESSGSSPKPN